MNLLTLCFALDPDPAAAPRIQKTNARALVDRCALPSAKLDLGIIEELSVWGYPVFFYTCDRKNAH